MCAVHFWLSRWKKILKSVNRNHRYFKNKSWSVLGGHMVMCLKLWLSVRFLKLKECRFYISGSTRLYRTSFICISYSSLFFAAACTCCFEYTAVGLQAVYTTSNLSASRLSRSCSTEFTPSCSASISSQIYYISNSPPTCSPLSPSITHSLFHSRLKTHLFHKSFPP